jgi:hypothetical protein
VITELLNISSFIMPKKHSKEEFPIKISHNQFIKSNECVVINPIHEKFIV